MSSNSSVIVAVPLLFAQKNLSPTWPCDVGRVVDEKEELAGIARDELGHERFRRPASQN